MKSLLTKILTTTLFLFTVHSSAFSQQWGNALALVPGNRVSFEASSSPNLVNNFSIGAWIYIDASCTNICPIVANKLAGNNQEGFAFYVNNWNTSDRRLVLESNVPGAYTSINVIPNNVWTHVAITVSSTNVPVMYVNGVSVALESSTVNITGVSNKNMFIGCLSEPSYQNYSGKIDELSIWNRVLTPAEINSNRSEPLVGTESGLIGYYNFNQGVGGGNNIGITTLPDVNGTNNGTLINFTLTGEASNWVGSDIPTPHLCVTVTGGASLKNGLSWETAYDATQLQQAIDGSFKQVWVAAGVYKPTLEIGGSGDRYKSFRMKNGVAIYGGFTGTETSFSQRNMATNVTILSGDIGTAGNNTDNSYHVFYHPSGLGLTSSALLDGFTISGGNANGSSSNAFGGGMYNLGNSPTITNCTIKNNNASSNGGGIYNRGGASPLLSNCTISGNTANYGGGIFNESAAPTMINCKISGNTALVGGGLNNNFYSTATFINCVISGNTASSGGGGIYNNESSTIDITNCTISGNSALNGGGLGNDNVLTIKNSIIWGNTATTNGKQIANYRGAFTLNYSCYANGPDDVSGTIVATNNNITTDPKIVNSAGGDYRIFGNSPCVDAGLDSYNGQTTDIRGAGFGRKLLKTNHATTGTIDMGAYEYKEGTDPLSNCANPINGGEIAGPQTICYNTTPTAFTSTSLPTGHTGTLEYKWQISTTSASLGFSDIASSNAATFTAGILTTTTWYKRLARVDCETDWTGAAESNVLEVKVNPLPTPTIYTAGSTTLCNGDAVALSAGGNALEFGSNSRVEIDDNAALRFTSAQSYTLAAWIYVPNNTSSWRGVITKSRDIILNGHYGIYINAENKWVYGGDLNIVGGAATPGWHHVAIVQQGNGNRELFVDGVSNVIGTAKNAAGTGKLRIGQSYDNFENFDGGIVDECVLFNTNLSQATIQSWMNKSLTSSHPNYSNIVGYWKLDEGIGALTTADASGNGHTGTLVNSPVWVATTAPVNQYASYLWSPGGITTPINNVNTSGTYTVTVTDANGCSNTSAGTTVTVRDAFTPGEISATGQSICYAGTPAVIGSSIAASGGDGNITYEWRSSADSYATAIAGATSETYTPPAGLTVTTSYRRYAHDGICNTTPVVSNGTWTVTVLDQFTAGSIIASQSICYNSIPTTLTGVAPTGGNIPYTYQWQSSEDNLSFTDIPSANDLNYSPGALIKTTYYKLIQTSSSGCGSVSTNTVTITVYPDLVVGSISDDQTICYNTTPDPLTGMASTGGNPNYSYQWQQSTDNVNFTDILDATNLDYSPATLTETTHYRLNQTSGCESTSMFFDDGSAENALALNPTFLAWLGNYYPVAPTFSGKIKSVDLYFEGTSSPGLSVDIFDDNQVLIGSSNVFTTPNDAWATVLLNDIPITGPFYVMVKWNAFTYSTNHMGLDENGPYANDGLAFLMDEFGNLVPLSSYGFYGVFLLRPTVESCGGSGKMAFVPGSMPSVLPQTKVSKAFSPLPQSLAQIQRGTTSDQKATPPAPAPFNGKGKASNSSCGTVTTNTVTINVYNNFTTGAIETTGETICYNGDPASIGSSIAASGGDEIISYQWQSSTDAEFTTPITISSNTATYDPASGLLATTWYRRQAMDATCNTTFTSSTGVWKVAVYNNFTAGSIETTGETICEISDPIEIPNIVLASGGDENISYQWQSSTDNFMSVITDIASSNVASYNPPTGLTTDTWFRRQAKDAACNISWVISSGIWKVDVESVSVAGSLVKIPDALTICENTNVSAILTPGNGGNGLDELEFRTNDGTWSTWTTYISGTEISTTDLSGVEIRTRRTATYCENSAYTTVSWSVEATPIAGSLTKTPDAMNVCENDIVSAIFTSGNGGNGIDELESRTNNGTWSAWAVYTSGAEIPTADLSGVEIRTRRTASTCSSSAYTTVGWSIELTPIAGSLTKTPDVMNVCENDIVSAIFTSGNGGNGIDELEFRTNNGTWSAWAVYTSGTSISTADLSGVEIRTRRTATTCTSSAYTTVSWIVEATPIAGLLTRTPDVMNVCENDIVSAILTSGNGGNGIDELEFRTNNGTWSAWAAYVSGADISTAVLSGVEIRTRRTATTCTSSAYTTVSWIVEATPIAGLLAKTPDVMNVCENDIVSAIFTPGNGGNGIDELEFRTNDGTWSAWAAYVSGTNISTADLSGVEIRSRRTSFYCENSAYTTVSWNVEATPIAGLLTKTPDVMNICENDNVSTTLTIGNGGNGIDELEFRTNDGIWSAWAAYVSGSNISTADLSGVEIRTRRDATYCENSAYTTVGWTIEATPIEGLLTKTPDVMNVCKNDIVSAIFTPGNGGNGIDELEFRTNNGIWSAWAAYTSGTEISTADLSGVEIRTRRTATTCSSSAYTTVSWNVEANPIAGFLTKTPDAMNVCENDIVSAILTSGNGGNGIDELELRTYNGSWSTWAVYTSGAEISTADLSGVEIRSRRTATICSSSAYTTINWTVESTPIVGSLAKTPDVMNVCENDKVSAILTSGNGGNGVDELEFRTNNGMWSVWTAYTSGADISTADLSGVEIRSLRTSFYCENSAYTTVSWNVEATPIAGLLTKTPDVMNICENDNVSATLTIGNGGNGIDELEFRTNDGIWSAWATYTSCTEISTADLSGVEIRTRRTSSYCESTAYVTVGWIVEATPIAGLLTKTPDLLYICENENVSAIFTSGSGGNGIDELEFRTNNGTWSAWAAYTSGADISTADLSGVEIRTRRTSSYCENLAYTTVNWIVETTPIAGSIVKTPDVMNICENEVVSAIFTPGNGGNGIDELLFRTNNGAWSTWAVYTSGAEIPTAHLSGVEIRTRRTSSYCGNTDFVTVGWIVEATPIAGLLSKTPDVTQVCENDIVSATLTSGNGGNGMDKLEYRTKSVTWSAWAAYTSGADISTADRSGVEIRTRRNSSNCENSGWNVVRWNVNPAAVAGIVSGLGSVCYGSNSTLLHASGYTGSIVMWQSSTNNWTTITNIQHTQPTLLVENLTVTTKFRTVVRSGNCGQLYSMAAEIKVNPIPAPFITGAGSVCDLEEIYAYTTEPNMVGYQWSVSSGQIISGQGSNLVTVKWIGLGNQSISVDYQTTYGCTMPQPFSFTVQIFTPETPVITLNGLTLTSSAFEGNQWFLNGMIIEGATSRTYVAIANGDYSCIVTLNECPSAVSNIITIQNVGADPLLSFSMDVYPVPNNGLFTVKLLSPGSSNYTLTVYNAIGSVVYSKESIVVSAGFSQMVDLANSPTGVYTVVMQSEKSRFIRKIVILDK